MSMEAPFVLPEHGLRRPVGEYICRLTEAGYPCHEESDEYGLWIVFDGLESTLVVSVEDGTAVFVTFEMSLADPVEAIEAIGRVFTGSGWETEPLESD